MTWVLIAVLIVIGLLIAGIVFAWIARPEEPKRRSVPVVGKLQAGGAVEMMPRPRRRWWRRR